MKISYSYSLEEFREAFQAIAARHEAKIEKLLKRYSPDLVHLHGCFEKHSRKREHAFSLTLSLPTGKLHATATESEVRLSAKKAFSDLEKQLKKHQSLLRKDYEWKRKRPLSGGTDHGATAAD